MKWAIVCPSNRPERLKEWERRWGRVLDYADVFVVRDEPPWDGIPEFIPRRTDMIRSWGFYKAWERGATYTLSLDDDVSPLASSRDVLDAYERAFDWGAPYSRYFSVGSLLGVGPEMRGFPYEGRDAVVGLQFGGWNGSPDLDAVTQLARGSLEAEFAPIVLPVPVGSPVTGCAMNFAFRTELTPMMWQLPLFEGRYNRFGDIWGGLFAKKTLDRLGYVTLVNGEASVLHERASDPFANIVREAPGLKPNEGLWAALNEPKSILPVNAYREVTDDAALYFSTFDLDYALAFEEARDAWLTLFNEPGTEQKTSTAGSMKLRLVSSGTFAAEAGAKSAAGGADQR